MTYILKMWTVPTITVTANVVTLLSPPTYTGCLQRGFALTAQFYLPSSLMSTIHSFTIHQLSRGARAKHAAHGKRFEPFPHTTSRRSRDIPAAWAAPNCSIFPPTARPQPYVYYFGSLFPRGFPIEIGFFQKLLLIFLKQSTLKVKHSPIHAGAACWEN